MKNKIAKKVCIFGMVVSLLLFVVSASFAIHRNVGLHIVGDNYILAWPGILPDSILYKVKLLRNKLIEKMIVSHIKKIEFDLLMADKTIYASKLLADKSKTTLAQETALKGENYYSKLVQNYNIAQLNHDKIPASLDKKITLAAFKHQEILKELMRGKNNDSYAAALKFSEINYDFITKLRESRNEK